jgi:hypothetical protein
VSFLKKETKVVFNTEGYFEQIQIARDFGFNLDFQDESSCKQLLIRHDLDFHVECVLEMAEVERRYGVRAIYCILATGSLYSLGDFETAEAVKALETMGHEIGLHFNPEQSSSESFRQQLSQLESITKRNVKYFSQHQPTIYGFVKFPGEYSYVNLYDKSITGEYKYVSDSCMLPREDIYELLPKFDKIQYLTHPEFWALDSSDLQDFENKLKMLYKGDKSTEIENTVKIMADTVRLRGEIDKVRL